MDPAGSDAGLSDPYPLTETGIVMPPKYPGFGDLGSDSMTCVVDFLPTSCTLAMGMIQRGTAEFCPDNRCGPRVVINGVEERLVPMSRDPETGQLGYGFWDESGNDLGVVGVDKDGIDIYGTETNGKWTFLRAPQDFFGLGFGGVFMLGIVPQKTTSPNALFKRFLSKNPDCAKKIQQAGDKLNPGSYLNTPWSITDTYPNLYDKPGVIPNQENQKFSTPREFFENKRPGWNAATFVTREGDKIIRNGTFLGEGYHYSYIENPNPRGEMFVRVRNSDILKGATLLDESLHNYFAADHHELIGILGIDAKGKEPTTALRQWIRGGCK